MNYREITYELMELLREKRKPIDDFMEMEQGENGILQVLLVNEKNKGECLTPGELSAVQELSTGRVAAALKGLEQKGYIERTMDKEDRRRIFVTLTENGRDTAQKMEDEEAVKLERILRKIGEEDAEIFFRILKKVITEYDEN